MRAALYARYSSDLQSDQSVEDQLRLCREKAKELGHTIVSEYTDHAISGGHLANRPGVTSLMDAVKAQQIDYVIAEALDRVSRDQEGIAAIYKRMQYANVTLHTLSEGIISELHIGLKGTMNALFLKDLADKTRRGQRGRVEAGKIPGGNSYGYKVVNRLLEDGSLMRGERKIIPEETEVIRRIYNDYASGISPRKIAATLNASCIPSPRGGFWNASTINGSKKRRNGILNNELYRGRIIYNHQHFVKDPETGKQQSRANPPHKWVTADVPELRIVDEDIWQAVQAIKSKYSSQSGNRRQTKKRLLTGLVKCGQCGGTMTIINRNRYYCCAKLEKGICSSKASIKADLLEEGVLEGLKNILLGKKELLNEFARTYRCELKRLQKEQRQQSRHYNQELEKVNTSIKRCLDYIMEGNGAPDLVSQKLEELEARKKQLEQLQQNVSDCGDIHIHPNIGELYQRKINELQNLLRDDTHRTAATEVIRSLIDRIDIIEGTEKGKPEIFLVGALAGILAFTQNKTAVSKGHDGRILMVAGARFELATFRL